MLAKNLEMKDSINKEKKSAMSNNINGLCNVPFRASKFSGEI
jgi:hypothetical protein